MDHTSWATGYVFSKIIKITRLEQSSGKEDPVDVNAKRLTKRKIINTDNKTKCAMVWSCFAFWTCYSTTSLIYANCNLLSNSQKCNWIWIEIEDMAPNQSCNRNHRFEFIEGNQMAWTFRVECEEFFSVMRSNGYNPTVLAGPIDIETLTAGSHIVCDHVRVRWCISCTSNIRLCSNSERSVEDGF